MRDAVSIRVVPGERPETFWLWAEVYAAGPGWVAVVSYALAGGAGGRPTGWREGLAVGLRPPGVYGVRSDRPDGAVGPPRVRVRSPSGSWHTG